MDVPLALQIKFITTVLACRCVRSWSFAHRGIMGVTMGMIKIRARRILRIPKFTDQWADSLQIKLIGIGLACRFATLWPFAHWEVSSLQPSWPADIQCHGHFPTKASWACPMGVINTHGILWMLKLSKHKLHLGLLMCNGMVICESWPHGRANGRTRRLWDLVGGGPSSDLLFYNHMSQTSHVYHNPIWHAC